MKLKWFIFLAVLVIGMLIYYFFYGTPWGVKEYKHRVLTYLEKKYHQEFTIDEVDFDFFHSQYSSTAHAKNHPDQKFHINSYHPENEFWDSYYSNIAERQMKNDWNPVVKGIYPDQVYSTIEMMGYMERNDGGPPNYIEDTTFGIGISLEKTLITEDNKEQELKRAFELLMKLKRRGAKLGYFQVIYKNKLLQVHPDEVKEINTAADLGKYLTVPK